MRYVSVSSYGAGAGASAVADAHIVPSALLL